MATVPAVPVASAVEGGDVVDERRRGASPSLLVEGARGDDQDTVAHLFRLLLVGDSEDAERVGDEAAGTFDDLTQLGPGEDDIDRQLRELSSSSQVDSELEKMRAANQAAREAAERAPSA